MEINQVIFAVMVTILFVANCYARPRNQGDDVFCSRTYSMVESVCDGCYATTQDSSPKSESAMNESVQIQDEDLREKIRDKCCNRRCTIHKMMQFCCEARRNEFHKFLALMGNTDN